MPQSMKITSLGLAFICALLFTACIAQAETQADYPSYGNVSEIAAAGDVIVQGEVLGSHAGILYPSSDDSTDETANPQGGLADDETGRAREEGAVPVTISSVRVIDVLKGDAEPGDVIQVSQPGGSGDGGQTAEGDAPRLGSIAAESLILVLAAHDDAPFDLLNPTEAVFTVDSSGKVTSLSSANGFEVSSLEDLKKAVASAG